MLYSYIFYCENGKKIMYIAFINNCVNSAINKTRDRSVCTHTHIYLS